ncbi:hypothetical protein BJX66DRAFT_315068 [Aspergillus keveii]|uniref:Uncharacterized protein n=1 Tax=Aspergillus keveii TaxID=714993 RepID=A0ABR4FPX1_9EURO
MYRNGPGTMATLHALSVTTTTGRASLKLYIWSVIAVASQASVGPVNGSLLQLKPTARLTYG